VLMNPQAGALPAPSRYKQSIVIGRIAALVDFMIVDGGKVFDSLTDQTQDELRTLLGTLNAEMLALNAQN
jgi:hypothetical protein